MPESGVRPQPICRFTPKKKDRRTVASLSEKNGRTACEKPGRKIPRWEKAQSAKNLGNAGSATVPAVAVADPRLRKWKTANKNVFNVLQSRLRKPQEFVGPSVRVLNVRLLCRVTKTLQNEKH